MNLFINRELSLLEFNHRVLAQATDSTLPLLERCASCASPRTTSMNSSRSASPASSSWRKSDTPATAGPDRHTVDAARGHPCRAARLIDGAVPVPATTSCCRNWRAGRRVDVAGQLVAADSTPGSAITSTARSSRCSRRSDWIRRVPFPRIQNKSLNFIVRAAGKDAFGRDTELRRGAGAARAAASCCRVPREISGASAQPDAAVQHPRGFVPQLFPGMTVRGCIQFRVTRNSDLFVDDEEVDDLRAALEGELAQRRYGAAVRLETIGRLPRRNRGDFLLRSSR
jgi:polyphosphate kinase